MKLSVPMIVFAVLIAGKAHAAISTAEMSARCDSNSELSQGICIGFILGALNSITEAKNESDRTCIPYNVKDGSIIDLVAGKLREFSSDPMTAKMSAYGIATMVIQVNFMCKK